MNSLLKTATTMMLGIGMAGAAHAAEILVTSNIAVSTTWTANNTYNLQTQIYVLPGATLTIEAGTVIASDTNIGGSLAVTRGAQIFVLGTATKPVIMTSKADTATWTGGNPKTGTWHEGANEWGNLTLMGNAYISENAVLGNVPTFNAANRGSMEGLVAAFPGDPNVLYGGGNDDDDSGSIGYLSLRYGGKIVALNTELNGLSLGGIGRNTELHHIDIMNNVDDGIEIWGGTLNLKYFNIWNIGDDCFDVDQGWRGKAQFGLLVQGYSVNASQGSGVGDNGFEMDGAEDSDAQPVTTAVIDNCTFIGQPIDGDQATTWRDNARVQFHNCIIMDTGEDVVHLDNVDGDGAHGYGFNGTLTWLQTWATPWNTPSAVNPPILPLTWAQLYQAQSSGNLAEITDTVFWENLFGTAYNEANNVSVFAGANNNVQLGSAAIDMPIKAITRGPLVIKGGKSMLPVVSLDPRPDHTALTSVGTAPNDGFFTPAQYRGAFAPGESWLSPWTASFAFGFTPTLSPWSNLGRGLSGVTGEPNLFGTGTLVAASPTSLKLTNAKPSTPSLLFVGIANNPSPFKGGTLIPVPTLVMLSLNTSGTGAITLPFNWPNGLPSGFSIYFQWAVKDPAALVGVSISNALQAKTP